MSESERSKSFWATLPGLLAGLGTFITAIVALLGFIFHQKADKPFAPVESHRLEATLPVGRSVAPKIGDICQQVIGHWTWFTGSVNFTADGFVGWKPNPNDLRPLLTGTWTCTDPAARRFAINWPNGFIDTLTLSGDRNHLSGTNQVNYPISGTRAK